MEELQLPPPAGWLRKSKHGWLFTCDEERTAEVLISLGYEPLYTAKDFQLYRLQLELRAAGAGHP